jgi:hypothetical protein
MLRIAEVDTRRDRAAFLEVPALVNRHARWVPPLAADERRILDRRRNLAYRYCDATAAVAWRGDVPVGRVVGLVNRRHNERTGEATARFGFLESPDDPDVVRALLAHVETWAGRRGMRRVVGPLGFTDQDPEGLLIDGFDTEPSIASPCNAPYLPPLVEAAGYEKDVDYVVYRVPVPERLPAIYERILERLSGRGGLRLVEPRRRSELRAWGRPVLELMSETFSDLYGFVPPDPEELEDLVGRFLPVLDPRFIKMAVRGDRLVGFIIAMPNLAPGLRRSRGRLFPLGFVHLLRAARRSRQLDLLMGGIRLGERGRGVDALLGAAMMVSARQAGFTTMDSHHELEDNLAVRAEMERPGGIVYKRFRVYRRSLGPGRAGAAIVASKSTTDPGDHTA